MLDWTINDNFGRENIHSWGGVNTHTGAHVTWNDASTAAPANDSKFRVEANANYAHISMPRLTWNAIYPDIVPGGEQGSVYVKFVMPTTAQTVMATGVYLRAGSSGRYYEITYTSWNNRLRIRVWNTGSFGTGTNLVELNSVAFTPVRGEYYWMRVDFSNSGLYAKCWRATNTAEPSAWTVSTTGNNYPVNRVGVIGYHEHSTNQTFRVSNFMFRHTNGLANASSSTNVFDTFNDYRRFDLGRSSSNHDWHGDHAMSPTFYQNKRSAGNMVTNVASGVSNAFATIRRGVAVNRTDHSWIGPNYTTGSAYIHFSFESVVGRLSLMGRVTPAVSSGNAAPTTMIRVMVYASGSFAVYSPSGALTYHSHGLAILPNVEYKMRIQITAGNRVYAKLWSGSTEPDEWVKLGVVSGMSTSGKFGFRTENQTAYNGYRIYDYGSTPVTYKNIMRVYTTSRAIKFTMSRPTPKRTRRVTTPTRKMTMAMTAYPLRTKISASSLRMKHLLSGSGMKRINIASHRWVNGVWTRTEHVPNLSSKFKSTNIPLRTRLSKVTRAIKFTAVLSGRRVRKSTVKRGTKFTLTYEAQVIPDNEANLDAKFFLSTYAVITKGGEADLGFSTSIDAGSILSLTGSVDIGMRTILDAQIPGFFVVRAFGHITSSMGESTPFVKYVDTSDAIMTHTLNSYGLVQAIHFGSLDVVANFRSDFKTSLSAVGEGAYNITSKLEALGIRSYLNTFSAGLTTGYVLDRPDFEDTFKELIERRASFIHYACTYHSSQELIIRYRHKRTMSRSSVTYFIANDAYNDEPLLYGASIDMWDDDMIIIHMSDNVSDDLVQKVREQFELSVDRVAKLPRFHRRPAGLLVAPKIAEKPFHQRPYHLYVDSPDEVPDNLVPMSASSLISAEHIEHADVGIGPVRIEGSEEIKNFTNDFLENLSPLEAETFVMPNSGDEVEKKGAVNVEEVED